MEISEDLYSWLRTSDIIPPASKYNKKNSLSELDIENFEYGCLFSTLLLRTTSLLNDTQKKIVLKNSISSLKPYKTKSAMKFNWSIINLVLTELGIHVDFDDIELIKAGSKETLEQLLEKIFKYEQNMFEASDSEVTSKQDKSNRRYKSGELVIEAINASIPLASTESSLEFLLVSFCKHFNLHPKQAAGLLTQSGKYLAYICSRGFKGKHDIISEWLDETSLHSDHLASILIKEQNQNSLPLVLTALSHSLNSRNVKNVEKSSKVLKKIYLNLVQHSNDLEDSMWTWFSSEGIEKCLSALKRFGAHVKVEIISILSTFASSNFKDLFTSVLPELIPEIIQYLAFMHELLVDFAHSRYQEFILNQGIYEFLIELALDQAENFSVQPDERMTSINILCEIWQQSSKIEEFEEFSSRTVKIFEKVSREKSHLLKIACLGRFFALLEHFVETRNSFAPVVYKIITFALVENYSEHETKEFIMNNFLALFEKIEIPLKILVEPLAKHLTISIESDFSITDFYFFAAVAAHQQLNVKLALVFIDSLAKLLVDHEFYAELIGEIMVKIIKSFEKVEIFQEYLQRFVKVYLKILVRMSNEAARHRVYIMQKIIENCLALAIEIVNNEAQINLCAMLVDNNAPLLNDWIMNMLEICGNPEEIIEKYKKFINFEPERKEKAKKTEEIGKNREKNWKNEKKEVNDKEKPADVIRKTMRKQIETISIKDEPVKAEVKPCKMLEQFNPHDLNLLNLIKKSKKFIFSEIFKKFSTKRKISNLETFDKLNESTTTILDTDIFKILKKLISPGQMLTQSQFVEFSKEFCELYNKSKSYFDLSEFQDFLAYISRPLFSKPPNDFSLYPSVYGFLHLIDLAEQEFFPKRVQPQQVSENSETPAGYKKVKTKEVQIFFYLPAELNLPPSSSVSISVLDDLLSSLFGFHIIEPQVSVTETFKLLQDRQNFHSKTRSSVSQTPKKVLNKFEEKKIQEKLAKIEENKEKEKKRLLRVQVVRSQISKMSSVAIKKIEEKKKNKDDEEKKVLLIRKLEEKIERDRKARLEEIVKWKSQKEEELKQKNELEKQKLIKEREERIRKRDEFLESEKERLKNLSLELAENKKKIPEIEAKKQEIEKKLREKKIEKHKTTLEIARKQKQETELEERELMAEFNSEDVQSLLKQYENSFQLVFLHFCSARHLPNAEVSSLGSQMSFPNFHRFAVQFKLTPELISKEDTKKFFMQVRKESENPSISFEGFKFLTFKISKLLKSESGESSSLKDFFLRLELSKDINSVRNLLRKQESLKSSKF